MSGDLSSPAGESYLHDIRVVVTALAFSNNALLRTILLERFPNSEFNDRGAHHDRESLNETLAAAHGVIVGGDMIDERVLTHCPKLQIVAKYGVGLDNIDMDACQRHTVHVAWTPGVNKLAVAEQTIAFMLTLSRNLLRSSMELKNGTWQRDGGAQLNRKTVGLIGMGHIGKEVVRLLEPFGCRILVNDIVDQTEYYRNHRLTAVSKEVLFRESDIVSIHTPLNEGTRHMVDRASLSLMKESAILINTARGAIVNESDLKTALVGREIRAVGLDVYESEPASDLELLQLPNVFCTPHIAGNSVEAVHAMGLSAIDSLSQFFHEHPTGIKSAG
jgi:phosphoglycerate dehydrogenase-like enzyme